jgi:hypothetical protein
VLLEGGEVEPGALAAASVIGEVKDMQESHVHFAAAAFESERPSAGGRVQDGLVGEMILAVPATSCSASAAKPSAMAWSPSTSARKRPSTSSSIRALVMTVS